MSCSGFVLAYSAFCLCLFALSQWEAAGHLSQMVPDAPHLVRAVTCHNLWFPASLKQPDALCAQGVHALPVQYGFSFLPSQALLPSVARAFNCNKGAICW